MNSRKTIWAAGLICFIALTVYSQTRGQIKGSDIELKYKGDAQIEIGNAYAGVEMHHSSMLPERISFYYPVANSIDLSTDYFHRDTTYVMKLGLRIGYGPKEWLGTKPSILELTPYKAVFLDKDSRRIVKVSYEFCKNYPAMVITYDITNAEKTSEEFEFYTHLETSVHTSHTYVLKDKANTEFDTSVSAIYTYFNDRETQDAGIFVLNAGDKPNSFNSVGDLDYSPHPSGDIWLKSEGKLPCRLLTTKNPGIPAAEFLYKKKLNPSQHLTVVQIIGQCGSSELKRLATGLPQHYRNSIFDYEKYVLDYVNSGIFRSGDNSIDHSYLWAKAILAVDKHYIDKKIRPMPCPAEYNFYFTHDVLLTDLAAVNFDLPRVKEDLLYTIEHADKNNIIPHAYYWKDTSYTTEYAASDNWNHFWFIIASASYLRHSGDLELVKKLYPYISESLNLSLTNMKDSLMWASRPDWWDLGNNYGPRSYMTALEIKALNDYNYISESIGKNAEKLEGYDRLSLEMRKKLNSYLWSDKYKFLMNYVSDGSIDPHYYIGSLIAALFNSISGEKLDELVKTAGQKMLDPKVGIYNAFPMDFEKLKKFWNFADDEQGQPFLYMNGGIWPHGNAWYALALIAAGEKNEALNFIKNIMTVKGIMKGPNGQPAMYEVRNGNYLNPSVYGKVDKPEFMWAAAWYIYTIYHLYGLRENSWNISLNPFLSGGERFCNFTLTSWGQKFRVFITGKGNYIKNILINGVPYPSSVLPSKEIKIKRIDIEMGKPVIPYVAGTGSLLESAYYSESDKSLNFVLSSFKNHISQSQVISPYKPKIIIINGKEAGSGYSVNKVNNIYKISVETRGSNNNIRIKF